MSNVVDLPFARRLHQPDDQTEALAACFASLRHGPEDVYWLKENAELLNVLETANRRPSFQALAPYAPVYDGLWDRFSFFPQYYRFLLSICLDLEDLGLPGDTGTRIAETVARQGLIRAELSDLQRGEAQRLLARRGQRGSVDPGLNDRLRGFCEYAPAFALPNKKAAYELTHIVFYLSEYGRTDPDLPPEAETSLRYAGCLAYLEGNSDLLAEICIALRFAGHTPPALWENDVQATTRACEVVENEGRIGLDDYHSYLMGNWHGFLTGSTGFSGHLSHARLQFLAVPPSGHTALRELSEALYDHSGPRLGSWDKMQSTLGNGLGLPAWTRLTSLTQACPDFPEFFQIFARETADRAPCLAAQ